MNRKIQLLMAAAGTAAVGIIVYKQLSRRKYSGIKLKRSVIIDKPATELYRYWKNFRNLPVLVDRHEPRRNKRIVGRGNNHRS